MSTLLTPVPEKPLNNLKFNPMKQKMDTLAYPPGRIYLKLALFGCFLLGFAYGTLLLLNTVFNALH
jgi:hypothetical protein